jgi:DNA polymerase-3 subunit beta
MKFTIAEDELNEAIQIVSKAISNRTSIPILSGIKLDADHQGLTLTASDTEISIQSFIPLERDERQIIELDVPGSVVLPAKFFSEIVRKVPTEQIEIEVTENFRTLIRSGTLEVQIVGLDPEEYPLLPQIDGNRIITLPSDIIKSMIRQTVFAVSSNESTPILTGVLWTISDGIIKFTGCDRHRLATREARFDSNQDIRANNIVVAGKTLNELQKILPDQNVLVDIVLSENQLLFKLQSVLFYTRILDGTYPDTSKLIPQSFQTELVVETKKLAEAIDRAYLLSREEKTNIVRMVMSDRQTIEVSSSSSELGKVTEQIHVNEISGELLKISFNSKYMLDALKVMDSEQIHIGFTGSMQPIIIKPADSTPLLQLILPYRTTN